MAKYEGIDTILLKKNRKAWRKEFGADKYDKMLNEARAEDKARAVRAGIYQPEDDEIKSISTQSSAVQIPADEEKMFYTVQRNNGTMNTNQGYSGGNDSANRPENVSMDYGMSRGQGGNTNIAQSGETGQNPYSFNSPESVQAPNQQQLLKQISDLETQQNNFLAANGGYVNTENLPILSGYQEKIAELRKQLETASQPAAQTQESGYATLGDAYADSVFGQTGAVRNTDSGIESHNMRTEPEDIQQMMAHAYGLGTGTLSGSGNNTNKLDEMIAQRKNENGITKSHTNQGVVQSSSGGSAYNPAGDDVMARNMPVQFSAQDEMPLHVGLNDGDEYPPEPSPEPVPPPPPVSDDHPDMEAYEEQIQDYLDEHEAWEAEVASIDEEKALIKEDLKNLSESIDDPDSQYIIENIIKKCETISGEMINVDDEVQQNFEEEMDDWEKYAQDLYNTYVFTGSLLSLGIHGGGGTVSGALMAVAGYLFSDSVTGEAPRIDEGNYMMYRAEYDESYGILGTSLFGGINHHKVLILTEVDENGHPVESNHTYVFDSYTNLPNSYPISESSFFYDEGVPAAANYFYEYGGLEE